MPAPAAASRAQRRPAGADAARAIHDGWLEYADATLVLLARDLGITGIATIDINDFSAYRTEGGTALRIVF